MSDRVFLDTNVLGYVFADKEPRKQERARAILADPDIEPVVSTQVLQEYYVVLTRKLAVAPQAAEQAVRTTAAFDVVPVAVDLVLDAIVRSRRSRVSFWDALIVESALAGRCSRLLTEDLTHAQRFGPLVVENPFR